MLQESSVSVQMRSTRSKRLSRRLGDKKEKKHSFSLFKSAQDLVIDLKTEKHELFSRLNLYYMSRKHFKRTIPKNKVTLKNLMTKVKQRKKMSSSGDNSSLL